MPFPTTTSSFCICLSSLRVHFSFDALCPICCWIVVSLLEFSYCAVTYSCCASHFQNANVLATGVLKGNF